MGIDPAPGYFKLFGAFLPIQPPEFPANANPPPPISTSMQVSGTKRSRNPNSDDHHQNSAAVAAVKKPRRKVSRKWPRLPPQPLPEPYREFLLTMMGACDFDDQSLQLVHVYTRTLYPSDLDKGLNRLPILPNQLLHYPFLTPQEEDFIQHKESDNKTPFKLHVKVIDPSLAVRTMSLTKWNWVEQDHFEAEQKEEKKTERKQRNWWYALYDNWMELVKANELVQGNSIQVWSFRVNGQLRFIIHKVASSDQQQPQGDQKKQLGHLGCTGWLHL